MKKYHIQHEAWDLLVQHRITDVINNPVLQKIAIKYGKTLTQIALRHTIQRGICVIPKTLHKERMAENLDLFDFILTTNEMAQIRAIDENKSLWYACADPKIVQYAMSDA